MTPEYRKLVEEFNTELREIIKTKKALVDPIAAIYGAELTRSQQMFAEEYRRAVDARDARDAAAREHLARETALIDEMVGPSVRAVHERFSPLFAALQGDTPHAE